MQLLRCPHRRRRPGGLAAHPFTGVNARLLVLDLFWSLPSVIGAHPGLCPFVVRLFRVDLLDCLGFGSRPDGRVARHHS
jgi:hypothetical protein